MLFLYRFIFVSVLHTHMSTDADTARGREEGKMCVFSVVVVFAVFVFVLYVRCSPAHCCLDA